MNILQRVYDWLDNIKTPEWIRDFLKSVQDMIVNLLLQIGKEYLMGLKAKILQVNDMQIPPEKKFELVFEWGKENIPDIKDSTLNMIIEILVNQIKR